MTNGIAFIDGQDAAVGTDEASVITAFFALSDADTYMTSIVGKETPVYTLTDGLERADLLTTITITPEPTSLGLLVLGGMAALRRRR